MILAKNRAMGPTLEAVRPGLQAGHGRGRMGAEGGAAATHMEITFRLPVQKGLEFMKLVQDTSRAAAVPILLWAGPRGEVDIIVRDQPGTAAKEPKTLLAARAEYRLPDTAPVMPPERESMVAGELAINPGRHEVTYKGQMVPQ